MKIVFAGDRDIAANVLKFIHSQGVQPQALLLSSDKKATHAQELISLCPNLEPEYILKGKTFREEKGLALLRELKPDYIIGIHFPYIIPKEVLEIPKVGTINLHPAYLPFNRGWHTPSWAILDDTPYGATLHFMDEKVDTGDIIHQKRIEISRMDTADSLYQRVKKAEYDVFVEAWPTLQSKKPQVRPQNLSEGTAHKPNELLTPEIQRIKLDEQITAGSLLKKIRALTTSNLKEAAYYEEDGKKYRVRIEIAEEKE